MLASESRGTPSPRRWWQVGFGGVAAIAVGLFLLMAWGKYDFCSGWAKHHEQRAQQLRHDASGRALPVDDLHEYLIAAEWHEIIARKYWLAALRPAPFGSYPKAPLVSENEQIQVLEELARGGQIPRSLADELLMQLVASR